MTQYVGGKRCLHPQGRSEWPDIWKEGGQGQLEATDGRKEIEPWLGWCGQGTENAINMAPRKEGPYFTSNLKKEAIRSSQMLVTTYKTTQCHNPEDHNLNSHHCENLKYHVPF
jgi:hypothetical protein